MSNLRRTTASPFEWLKWLLGWFFAFDWLTVGVGLQKSVSRSGVEISMDPIDTGGSNTDELVKASSTDSSADYLDAKVKNSIEVDSDQLQLDGDEASPAADYFYGTDGSGNKGWQPLPTADDELVKASSGDSSAGYLDAKVKNSIEVDADQLQLDGDEASPDAWDFYGKDDTAKGWHPAEEITVLQDIRYNETNNSIEGRYATFRAFDYSLGDWVEVISDPTDILDPSEPSSARTFNGSNQEFTGLGDLFSVGTSDFTLSVFFKTSSSANVAIAGLLHASTSYPYWILTINNGKIQWDFRTGASGNRYAGESTGGGWNDGAWHHLVLVFDNSTGAITIYGDGSTVSTTLNAGGPSQIAGDSFSLSSASRIGSSRGLSTWMNGSLSRIGFYGSALNSTQVTTLRNGGCGYSYATLPAGVNSPTAYFDCDEASGNLLDAVASHDGTAVNGPGTDGGPCS